jgi:ABC-type Fe3+-hydroxamate transport system substrate-binding protein
MMNKMIMVTGIVALCLVIFIVCAGCTSQTSGTTASQTTGSQPAVTTQQATGQVTPAAEVFQAASDQGLVPDESGDAVAQAEAFNTTQASNPAPDSTDFGDIMP